MMTREQYILRKMDIDAQMKRTRLDQHNELAVLNSQFEVRLRDHADEYRRQRQAIFDERNAQRLEIENHYKGIRRELWTEDVQLVEEWRAGLRQDEVKVTPPHDGRPYARLTDGRANEEGGPKQ